MFTNNELKTTAKIANKKMQDILNKKDEDFRASDLTDLMTLAKLKEAAEKKLLEKN